METSLAMKRGKMPEVESGNDGVLDADLPIVDCHHHLWVTERGRYLIDEFRGDLESGHNVIATVYVECSAMYRRRGPDEMRCVGEAEFVAGMAAMSESGLFGASRICEGFIGAADFTLGERVDEVLDALMHASGGRLRGIRGAANWDQDSTVNTGSRPFKPKGLLLEPAFRRGFKRLVERDLVYDAWQYHSQLPDVCDLADGFPSATIVVNHCGGLLGVGQYAKPETFTHWRAAVAEVSRRPNVLMKLGGLGAPRCGFDLQPAADESRLEVLIRHWRPYIETCIDLFGPSRCMFESNFPPDGRAGSYRDVWNAFKLITKGLSVHERGALFSENARRVYRLA
jgi:L-fuconolactonase